MRRLSHTETGNDVLPLRRWCMQGAGIGLLKTAVIVNPPGFAGGISYALPQYWVQSLSVHSEHFSAMFDFSQNRSGWRIILISQTNRERTAITTRETA